MPHAAAVHPAPETLHEIERLGLEFGTGINVAVYAAAAPAFTDGGPVTLSVNRLVIVTGTVAILLGSATLRAMTLAADGDGNMPGAV